MSEATLAIRPDEIIYISDEAFEPLKGEHQYQVMLVLVTSFPDPHHHSSSVPMAVVAIQEYGVKGKRAWGWIDIPPESKHQIGDLLVKANAKPNRWYWLLVSSFHDRLQEDEVSA